MKFFTNLLHFGFCGNYWGWFHALAGGILAKIISQFYSTILTVLVIFGIAILWEFIEFFIECKGDWQIVEITYGSKERWFYDSLGDIILAVIFAIVVVL